MPRKLPPTITFDDAEDEVLFTRAALMADPDASDLVPMTDSWLPLIDTARAKDRTARAARVTADAARIVANDRFDTACVIWCPPSRTAAPVRAYLGGLSPASHRRHARRARGLAPSRRGRARLRARPRAGPAPR